MCNQIKAKEKKDPYTIWIAIVGLVLSLTNSYFQLRDNFKVPNPQIRLLSNSRFTNTTDTSNIFVQSVSFYSLDKTLYLKDLKLYLRYPGYSYDIPAPLMVWMRNSPMTANDIHGNPIKRTWAISSDQYLINQSVFLKETPKVAFISFKLKHTFENPEYYRYEFVDIYNKTYQDTIFYRKINDNVMYVDLDEFLPPITQNQKPVTNK